MVSIPVYIAGDTGLAYILDQTVVAVKLNMRYSGAIATLFFIRGPLGPLLALGVLAKGFNVRYVGFGKNFELLCPQGKLESALPAVSVENQDAAKPVSLVSHNLW